jgi:hypothetical protein
VLCGEEGGRRWRVSFDAAFAEWVKKPENAAMYQSEMLVVVAKESAAYRADRIKAIHVRRGKFKRRGRK